MGLFGALGVHDLRDFCRGFVWGQSDMVRCRKCLVGIQDLTRAGVGPIAASDVWIWAALGLTSIRRRCRDHSSLERTHETLNHFL